MYGFLSVQLMYGNVQKLPHGNVQKLPQVDVVYFKYVTEESKHERVHVLNQFFR